ncbi:hypothetical protein PAXRUDRAFT_158357 [Paxillus rubicundulus Ve08.2h10]|uniref:Uncharacterized protein n=1 Tax=Paxillus rubicundulus Ve08.2h10 TaxID=930991 RepID=A0A0D0DGV9_9AGAM|nr:hypothetical protein PAXRUDRAFT_158357 [Paxillus rubicundulus Ve08.2h10]
MHRSLTVVTPYKPSAWECELTSVGILHRFNKIPDGIRYGFILDFPSLECSQTPPYKDSIITYSDKFNEIVLREIHKGRYIGPFTLDIIKCSLGRFQSSPLSIIPKLGRPGKFRLVQNFSFPPSPTCSFPNPSINSYINSDHFPSTWGKFSVVLLLISCLPPDSEASTRDVAEAYRTVPLHPSQWPATVVQISETHGCIDTCAAFGATPSSGGYGHIADAGAELFRVHSIGPLDKWVDDHIFIRIRTVHLDTYNTNRSQWHHEIAGMGMQQTGGHIWYKGHILDNGSAEEFSEDCSHPLKDLLGFSPRSEHDKSFTYDLSDIDRLSSTLGIPWETSKDQPFNHSTMYIGFSWDLKARTVALSPEKVDKYLRAIHAWHKYPTHCLQDVQELYGKLLHTCSVIPHGQAYLIAFSDASSGFGIAITISQFWRAWRLIPGWATLGRNRDIAWAEAIGFELLIRTLASIFNIPSHAIVYGDNTSVVEGWWNGRHCNSEVNNVFCRIHTFLQQSPTVESILMRYVPSDDNPADKPSRGIFNDPCLLLPLVPVPDSISQFLVNATLPLTPQELRLHREGRYPHSSNKIIDRLKWQ